MSKRERERGVEVHILDLEPIIEQATTFITTKRLDLEGVVGVSVRFAPWGTFTDAAGNTILVCSEGVGYSIGDDARIPLFAEHAPGSDGGRVVAMLPILEACVNQGYVEEHTTDEVVDLADYIRSFGERLESNFSELHRIATDPDAARRAMNECEGAHL